MNRPLFSRPETLEQMVERQHRASQPTQLDAMPTPQQWGDMRAADGRSKLCPTPMTPTMRARLEAKRQSYEWYK